MTLKLTPRTGLPEQIELGQLRPAAVCAGTNRPHADHTNKPILMLDRVSDSDLASLPGLR